MRTRPQQAPTDKIVGCLPKKMVAGSLSYPPEAAAGFCG